MTGLELRTLPDSSRPRASAARFLKEADSSEKVVFTVFVRPKADAPALPDLAYWQRTPLSERKFPTPEEYTRAYGSSLEDLAAVATTLEQHGLTTQGQHAGAGTVTATATVAQVKSVFGVQLNHYTAPTPVSFLSKRGGLSRKSTFPMTETHLGFDGELSVPIGLVGRVTRVVGLDTRTIAAPCGFSGDPSPSSRLLVTDIAGYYNFPTGIDASDQTIGIFNGDSLDASGKSQSNYNPSDITQYFASQPSGFTRAPNVVSISLTVGTNTYVNDQSNPTPEITQDIQTSSTIAQGCTVNVYFSNISEQGWINFLNRVMFPQGGEKMPNILSISWIMYDEATYGSAFSFLFQRLAAIGISVFAAAGDWGADDFVADGKEHVGYPASDPWVTCVGGTVVGDVDKGPPVTFKQFAWSDRNNPSSQFNFPQPPGTGTFGTTGGGMSGVFPTPDYQVAANVTQFSDSSSPPAVKSGGRFVPDIAGMVGYNGFVLNGSPFNFIGTSCAAPLYAGLFASLRSALGTSFGFLNPTLYQLGNTTSFMDVQFGNNDSGDAPDAPYFSAGVGYDPVTGWGSVNGSSMMKALAAILFPARMYVTVVKNTFGLAEVNGDPDWGSTLQLTLDGFAPNDLSAKPTVVNAIGSDVGISIGSAQPELSSQPSALQRIIFPVSISFGPKSRHAINDPAHPGGVFPAAGSTPLESTQSFSLSVTNPPLTAVVPIYLLPGADPYFSNLAPNVQPEAWYLSQDLRVFTVCPGINPSPIIDSSRSGLPTLTTTSFTDWEAGPGYAYIKSLLGYFNSPGSADPFSLLPDQSSALTEDSLVAPSQANPAGGSNFANYSFAVARVRLNGSSNGKPVKVFFRLFTSNHPQTWFLPNSSYAQSPPPTGLPEAPLVATDGTTVPFFASGNLTKNNDYVPGGVNNIIISGSGGSYTYFGCFIDVYSENYTIPKNGNPTPVSAFLMGGHQCLVAQIAYDDAPIVNVNGVIASPMNSDKLAQRNLQVSLSDNPGPLDTHLIPQTFDVAPTAPLPSNPGQLMDLPDELIVDWGNTPTGSTASIYWPSLAASDVIALAKTLYTTHQLSSVTGDPNTLQIVVPEGFTCIPIPFGKGPNIAGLMTIQLPLGIVQGQEFLLTVRRVATRSYVSRESPRLTSTPARNQQASSALDAPRPTFAAVNWRYSPGIFAIKIPVVVADQMLPIERDTQAIIAWRLNQLSPSDRWYKVMQRYLSYINGRVSGLGGVGPVVPSPTGVPTPPGGPYPHNCQCPCHTSHGGCGRNHHGHKCHGTSGPPLAAECGKHS